MKLKAILLAEDSEMDAELTIEALKKSNLANRVVRVKDGVETLEYLRCEGEYKDRVPGNPMVIFLDIKMPRMDGIEVLAEIRKDKNLRHLPIVILTSSSRDKDLYESYELGVNAYVVKPVDPKNFIEAINQIGMFWAVLNELPMDLKT